MTEKEKFQKTFEKLHASPEVLTEVMKMTSDNRAVPMRKRRNVKKMIAIAAAVAVVATGSAGYAKDIGGIQRMVQVWIHGDQTNAIFTADEGSYTLTYKDADGNEKEISGGGVAYERFGKERPATAEELWEEINSPEVEYKEDGSVWVYYLGKSMDITDKFKDGICYVQLTVGGETKYMTIKYQNGYAMSPHSYISPSTFN